MISIIVVMAIMLSTLVLVSVNADVTKVDGKSLGVSYSGGWDGGNTYCYVDDDGSFVMSALDDSKFYMQLQTYKDLNGGDKLIAEAKKHENAYIAWDITAVFYTADTPQALVNLTTGKSNWQGDFDNVVVSGEPYTYIMTVDSFENSGYDRVQFQLNNYKNWGSGLKYANVRVSVPYVYIGTPPTTTPRLEEHATLDAEQLQSMENAWTTTTTTTTTKPTTTTTTTTTSRKLLYGDCNADGSVNGKDVLNLRKYIVKLTDVIDTEVSDLNNDGNINGKDVLMLRKYIIGLIDRFPIEDMQPTTQKTTAATTVTTAVNSGITSDMRDITAAELVSEMNVGINIGNTLDSVGNEGMGLSEETSWGNPKITKQLIQSIKAAGFNTIRLPVTWRNHIDSNNQIDKNWLNRVREVVDYIMGEGMYCILNTHHEQNWLNTNSATMETRKVKFAAVWTQIANKFKDYNDHLIFEGFNEILRAESDWSSPSPTDLANASELAQVFVDTVRATGGNNSIRVLVVSTYGAGASNVAINGLVVPKDTVENKLVVEVHTYSPQSFCFSDDLTDTTWGTEADKSNIDNVIKRVDEKFISNGIPVIIGEFGAVYKNNDSDRAAYCEYMVTQAKTKGIKCIYWDNGKTEVATTGKDTYGLFDRYTYEQTHSEVIEALVNAAK